MADKRKYGQDLVEAVMSRDLKKVKKILKQGANLDHFVKGDTAIHLAARIGHKEIISTLITAGDSVNKGNQNGNTALHYTARDGRDELVKYLVEKGAEINCQNQDGDTPLHASVGYQPMDVIETYVKLGMDVNTQNKNGDTPLHVAVDHSRDESVEALLLSDADVDVTNNQGKKAYELARRENIAEMIKTYALLRAAMDSGYILAEGTRLRYRDIKQSKYLERVGITIDSMSLDEHSLAVFYCRREKYENNSVSFVTEEEEEVVSDVYHFRIRDVIDELKTCFKIPVYSQPSEKQQIVVKFIAGKGGTQILSEQIKTEEGIFCMVDTVLVPETTSVMVVCLCSKGQDETIGEQAQSITSDIEENFSIDIPEGAFEPETTISLKVFDAVDGGDEDGDDEEDDSKSLYSIDTLDDGPTENVPSPTKEDAGGAQAGTNDPVDSSHVLENPTEPLVGGNSVDENSEGKQEETKKGKKQRKGKSGKENKKSKGKNLKRKANTNLLSDVFQINITGEQPSKSVKMQLPLTDITDDVLVDNLQVVRMNDANNSEIEMLKSENIIDGKTVTFETEHFSTFVICPVRCTDLSKIVTDIQNAKHRRQEARFFAMVKPQDDNEMVHVLVVECIKSSQSKKRRKHWKSKGFEGQKRKHSSKIMLTPSQEFTIEISGDAKFDIDSGETGQRKLVFSPHRASYQPYQVALPVFYKDGKAKVHIYSIAKEDTSSIPGETGDVDMGPLENLTRTKVATLKIKLQLPPEVDPFGEEVEDALQYETVYEQRRKRLRLVWAKMVSDLYRKYKLALLKIQESSQAIYLQKKTRQRVQSATLLKKRTQYPNDILSGAMPLKHK